MSFSMVSPLAKWKRAFTLAAGTAGLMLAGTVYGEGPSSPAANVNQDELFQQVGYRLQQELDANPAVPPAEEVAAPVSEQPTYYAAEPAPEAEDGPWTVMSIFDDGCGHNRFRDNGWEFGGFSQWGYQDHPDGAFTGNGPFLNQKEWSKFNLNQQYFYFGKVADGSKGFDWGFRSDLLYGVDGNEAQSFGNNPGRYDFANGWDHGIYEWALPQLYAEIAINKLSVKLGHFYTPVGYEVIPSNGNFFLSRQLTFYNSEPFTHTGALGTYKASDNLQILSGWTFGMDTGFDQFNGSSSYLGGVIWKMSEKATLTYMMTGGNLGWRGQGAINSFILSYNWTDKLTTVHQFDVLGSNLKNGGGTPSDFAIDGVAGDSTGLINYAFYQINDQVKVGIRGEWYKADGQSYNTLTYGVNYSPMKNLVIRPEMRHMWSPNHLLYGPNIPLFNQNVFGIDAIFTF